MWVFSDKWLRRIHEQFEKLSDDEKPYHYLVATHPKFEALRNEIEEWVVALPGAGRNRLLKKLQSNDFAHTYNELVVGHTLQEYGYEVEYEKPHTIYLENGAIAVRTPDWYVYGKEGIPSFIVDVFTTHPSYDQLLETKQIGNLTEAVCQIPVDVWLNITMPANHGVISRQSSTFIAEAVYNWLIENEPPVGASLCLDGVTFKKLHQSTDNWLLERRFHRVEGKLCLDALVFRISAWHRGSEHVGVFGPGQAFMVNYLPLWKGVQEKVGRYREVDLPLAIAPVPDFLTGIGFDGLKDVLLGQEAIVLAEDPFDGEMQGALIRQNNGLFALESPDLSEASREALSAVLWVERDSFGNWRVAAIHNPSAKHPLPADAFNPMPPV